MSSLRTTAISEFCSPDRTARLAAGLLAMIAVGCASASGAPEPSESAAESATPEPSAAASDKPTSPGLIPLAGPKQFEISLPESWAFVEFGAGLDDESDIERLRPTFPDVADVLLAQRTMLVGTGTKLWAFDGADPITYLQIVELSGGDDLDLESVRDSFLDQVGGLAESTEAVDLPNARAELIHIDDPSAEAGPAVYDLYLVVDSGTLFAMTFSTDRPNYQSTAETFRAMAESLRLLGPAGTAAPAGDGCELLGVAAAVGPLVAAAATDPSDAAVNRLAYSIADLSWKLASFRGAGPFVSWEGSVESMLSWLDGAVVAWRYDDPAEALRTLEGAATVAMAASNSGAAAALSCTRPVETEITW